MKRRPGGWIRAGSARGLEFSKWIFIYVSIMATGVTVFACALMWRTGDTSGLAYLIPAVFAELATATGYYYNKAKAENVLKIQNCNEEEES